jgi:GTPase SAR1 family protein
MLTRRFSLAGDRGSPLILVGNKKDLADERQVGVEETDVVSAELGCGYVETSAKDNTNIDQVFGEILARSFGGCSSSKEIEEKRSSSRTLMLLSRSRRSSKADSLRQNSTGSDADLASPTCTIL